MQGYKKSILLIIFLSITISCKLTKNFETEPNNTFTNANKTDINKEIGGYLDNENDIDNFVLNVDEEQALKIDLSAVKGVNNAIYIYKNENPKPRLIKVIDDNRKSAPETFANLYVQPGQYFFSVTHGVRDLKKGNTETPYTMLITSRPYLNEEKEPNDNLYTSTELFDKTVVKGYFSPGQNSLNSDTKNMMKEIDWYKFNVNLPDNNPMLIDLTITGVPGVDSVITILNSSMEEILAVDNSPAGEGESVSDFGVKESGTCYVQISSKNFLLNNDTPYELKLDFKQYDPNSEIEPNNSFEKSNIILNNIINGKINSPDDKDFYQFTPSFKNSFYRAECSGIEGTDVTMAIYDGNRNKLFEINNNGTGAAEKIPYFLIKNSLYISISSSSVSVPDPRYTLSLEKYESDDTLEIEPDNSKDTANPLNEKITGYITYKNDTDFYLVKYDKRQKVKINVKGVKDGKIRVSTTDPLGFIIKSKEVVSDEEVSFSEIFDKKGYIIIDPVDANYENPYTINIEEQ